jgi:hypothetical protein
VVTRTGRPLVLPRIDAERVERLIPEPATASCWAGWAWAPA